MKKLIEDPEKFYEAKERPSGHNIGKALVKIMGLDSTKSLANTKF
jgi:site-specific DNA-methyltransferase (cytosine-N4-specific)